MNYLLFLFLSIITVGYLKAEPRRFEKQLPLYEVTAYDGRIFYLLGILPNAEGKLDMELLEEAGILGLLGQCDHLITEVKKFSFEEFFRIHRFRILPGIGRSQFPEYEDKDELRAKMEHLFSILTNFDIEVYARNHFNIDISHRIDISKDILLYNYIRYRLIEKIEYLDALEQMALAYHQRQNKNITWMLYHQGLIQKQEILLQNAYLNMDTVQMSKILHPKELFNMDRQLSISRGRNRLEKEKNQSILDITREWVIKMLEFQTSGRTFIAINIQYLLEEIPYNLISGLKDNHFKIRQISYGELK
jgi:hypothetical protein